MKIRQLIELVLTTGIMALIMSGSMLFYHFGASEEMLKRWITTYPIAWLIAIPGIYIAKKLVGHIMGLFYSKR